MKSLKFKDYQNRKHFCFSEKKILINKFLLIQTTNFLFNKKLKFFLLSRKKLLSKTKLNNRCIVTNRSRGNFRPFGFSRFLLRKFFLFGVMPGYKKNIW